MRAAGRRWTRARLPIAIAIAATLQLRSSPAWSEPSGVSAHALVRTGGWLGFATVGLGLGLFRDRARCTLTYGFIPAMLGGENLHELSVGATVRMAPVESGPWRWVPLYVGAVLLYTPDRHTFLLPAARYPHVYYAPTALHVLSETGTEVGLVLAEGAFQLAAFVELAGPARYWARWVANGRVVDLADILSPAFGWVIRW